MKISVRLNIIFLMCFIFVSNSNYAQEDLSIDDLLAMSLSDLMEVKIITAGKQSESISDIPASVIIVDRKDIETYGYNSIEQILQNIPGLFVIDDYSTFGSGIGVRGFWDGLFNRNMVFMIDNVAQLIDYTNSNALTTVSIPVEIVERIEIVRGPMSVIYGTGAFFGAINIITRVPDKSNKSLVKFSFGSNNNYKGILRFADKHEELDLNYSLNLSYEDRGGPDVLFSELRENYPAGWGVEENVSIQNLLERNKFFINFSGRMKNLTLNIMHTRDFSEGFFLFPPASDGDGHNQNSTFTAAKLNYRLEITDELYTNLKFGYYVRDQFADYDFFSKDFYGYQYDESKSFDTEVNFFYTPNEKIDLTLGFYHHRFFDFNKIFDLPSFLNPAFENNREYVDDTINRYAVFTQLNYSPWPKLQITAGLRMDKLANHNYGKRQIYLNETYNDAGDKIITPVESVIEGEYNLDKYELIPRLGMIYTFNENNIIKLLYGEAINHPSLFQNMKNLNNPEVTALKPEKIKTIELNYSSLLLDEYYVSLSLFRNSLDNLITRIINVADDASSYTTWNTNAGKMTTTGIEFTLRGEISNKLNYELSSTIQDTDDQTQGRDDVTLAYSPMFLGYIKINYAINDNLTFAFYANYVDRMESYWDDQPRNISVGDLTPLGRIGASSDSYINLNLNLCMKNFIREGITVNFSITNLLDEEIRYPTFTNNNWTGKGTLAFGRRFELGLTYNL